MIRGPCRFARHGPFFVYRSRCACQGKMGPLQKQLIPNRYFLRNGQAFVTFHPVPFSCFIPSTTDGKPLPLPLSVASGAIFSVDGFCMACPQQKSDMEKIRHRPEITVVMVLAYNWLLFVFSFIATSYSRVKIHFDSLNPSRGRLKIIPYEFVLSS